jgi:hypothetical protein
MKIDTALTDSSAALPSAASWLWDPIKERGRRWLNAIEIELQDWKSRYTIVFCVLIGLQFLAYTYFYTIPTFTDHTFPNVTLYRYPSHKTVEEGRWLADLIIFIQGGSGVQSFQMICATVLQALNGILFARFLGLRSKYAILGIAAIICLHPTFLDYYSFSIDHITFVLGDTFTILGAGVLIRERNFWLRIAKASFLFLLTIASYQPKLALVSFLALSAVLVRLTNPTKADTALSPARQVILHTLAAVAALVTAISLYWVTAKLLITEDLGLRTHTNTPREAIDAALDSYGKFIVYFTTGFPGMPHSIQFLPALAMVIGAAVLLVQAWRRGSVIFMWSIIMLGLMPVTLRVAFEINKLTPEGRGRILAVAAYCFVFFLVYGFRMKVARVVNTFVACICLYGFFVLATQESNAAVLKTAYETNFLNRIVARAEMVMNGPSPKPRPFVVAGHIPPFTSSLYARHPLTNSAEVHGTAFPIYREREILNFFLGRDEVRLPTDGEVALALESMKGRSPWPAAESVYLVNDTLVVLLEAYKPGLMITSAPNQPFHTAP